LPSRCAFSRYEGEFELRSATVTTDSASWQEIFGGNAVVFANSLGISRYERGRTPLMKGHGRLLMLAKDFWG